MINPSENYFAPDNKNLLTQIIRNYIQIMRNIDDKTASKPIKTKLKQKGEKSND